MTEKANNPFESIWAAQKNLFDTWQKTVSGEEAKEADETGKDYAKVDFYKTWMDMNTKLLADTARKFGVGMAGESFERMSAGADTYYNLFKFWQDLSGKTASESAEAVASMTKKWQKEYMEVLSNSFSAYIPQPYQVFFKDPTDVMKNYMDLTSKFYQPWNMSSDQFSGMFDQSLFTGSDAYLNFAKFWKENYDQTLGKFIQSPASGIGKEYYELQMQSFDSFMKYMTTLGEFTALMQKVGKETYIDLMNDYQSMLQSDVQPKTFKEFYEYWWKKNESAYGKLFITEDFARLLAQVVDAGTTYKRKMGELIEQQMEFMPIPKKADMDSLYRSVYEMKKELRSLRKEMKDILEKKKQE